MPANISTTEGGTHRFISRREPAWHGLGTVFEAGLLLTAEEATVMADCDYSVQKYPMIVNLPTGPVAADQVALVRMPRTNEGSYKILGNAGKNFEVVQNMEIAAMLNPLAQEWEVETVGALGDGEQFFICLNAGNVGVAGEEIRQYLLVNNNHDGKRSLNIALTPVRTVCENTLIAGINSAVLSAKIPHRSEIRTDAKFTLDIITSVRKQQQTMLEEFRAMALKKAVDADVKAILEAAYPDPRPTRKQMVSHIIVNDQSLSGLVNDNRTIADALLTKIKAHGSELQARQEKAEALRGLALERYDILNQEHTAIGGTVWGAYQAVTEVENYRGDGGKGTANSILWGERAANMGRAYGKCRELITIS
jgi:phage/plasmid-like protein (TIGR03299 family)